MPGQKGPAVVKPSICYMPIYLNVYIHADNNLHSTKS